MSFTISDWGRRDYVTAWEDQRAVVDEVLAGAPDTLIFVEHPPVLTLGASFHEENLLEAPEAYEAQGIAIERTDRGGDVTYHGPGQLVIYPIFDLSRCERDLHRWIRTLEATMIETCRMLGVEARRFPPHTGTWVGDLKLAAIGIKVRRWVSMHGIALNCDNDLAVFGQIIPCGIHEFGVTSLSQELGQQFTIEDAKPVVIEAFHNVIGS